jgi:hypothetical protein
MKKLVFLAILLITLTTCKKTFYKVELSGKVLDDYTNKPIAGIKVYFLGGNVSFSSSGPSYYEKTYVTTDSDGAYTFNFNANDNDAYALKPEYDKNTYFFDQNGDDRPVEVNVKKKLLKEKITQNIYLKKYSILNVRFKQVSTDTIMFLSLDRLDQNATFKWPGNGTYFPEYMADFTLQYTYYGNSTNDFLLYKGIKNSSITVVDTIYNINISKTEPTYFQINY